MSMIKVRVYRLVAVVGTSLVIGSFIVVAGRALCHSFLATATSNESATPDSFGTTNSSEFSESVEFVRLVAGGCAETRLALCNLSESSVEIAEIWTSCPCVTVKLTERRIMPRKTVEACVHVDLSDDRDFTGWLSPEIRFLSASGRPLFVRELRLEIDGEPLLEPQL